MGIPAYFSYIIKSHSKFLQRYNKKQHIDHLLLDSNSIIYDCIKDNTDDKVIINEVCKKLEYYIDKFNAKKSIYIAFDGVAPIAKLKQQRERRYKACFTKKLLNQSGWNSANITPGTIFMKTLSSSIHKYFKDNKKVIISCSNERGEGEHKLCKYFRDGMVKDSNVILYGLDADLIMLSLIHIKYCKNIFLYRETPEFIKQINKSLNPEQVLQYLLDTGLVKCLLGMLDGS